MLYHIVLGMSFGYSAILVPQLLDAQNTTKDANGTESIIEVTEADVSWIASVLTTVVLPTSFIGGIMIDSLGRLNTIKISAIPNVIGWILIATSMNKHMLIAGRLLTGTAIALGVSPAVIYVSEISSPAIRGALASLSPSLVSLGIMLVYLQGWFFDWRTVAWLSIGYIVVPIILIIIWLPESPTWLVSKNKLEQAKKSVEWFNKYQKANLKQDYCESQLIDRTRKHLDKQDDSAIEKLKMFAKPTVYKPMIFMTLLYFFQQFSGLFIILFYAVSFFNEVGTGISAYLAAVLVGAVRFGMSIVSVFLMKRFRRRPLIILSAIGMSLSVGVSGFLTKEIKEGSAIQGWIPVALILLYVASSMVGVLVIPWIIVGEIFPTSVRGIAHSIAFGIGNLLIFTSVQLYFTLTRLCGGLAGLQYLFAGISLSCAAFCYVFLPETHNKRLGEIQKYFERHWTYLSVKEIDEGGS